MAHYFLLAALVIMFIIFVILVSVQIYVLTVAIKSQNDKLWSEKFYDPLRTIGDSKHDNNVTMNDIFDQIYYIALPKRMENIQNVLKSFRIRAKKIEPVLKDTLHPENFVNDGLIDETYHKANAGRVACHLSHRRALQTFLQSDANTALILEDDLHECPNFKKYQHRLNSLIHELGQINWDVLYLGHCDAHCKKFDRVANQIYTNGVPSCRHAYAVNRAAAHIILENTLPMTNNGDEMIRRLGKSGVLNIYTIMPPIFYQNRENLGSNLNNFGVLKVCRDFEFMEIEDHE